MHLQANPGAQNLRSYAIIREGTFQERTVYDPRLVRKLCVSIALENDPSESERLMNLLSAIMKEDLEEVHLRLKLLKKLYDPILGAIPAEETKTQGIENKSGAPYK